MANSLRNDNHRLDEGLAVTTDFNTDNLEVGGARGYSVLVKLTDNGSAAGTVSLRAGLSEDDFITMANTTTTMVYTTGECKILFNVTDPHYKYMDVIVAISAGDLDYTVDVTIIEGET